VTVTAFSPNSTQVFQFQATLDGAIYTARVPWNVYRQSWYISVSDQSDKLIVYTPLVGSPPLPASSINLVGGYFTTSTLCYYPDSGTFVVTP